MLCILRGLHLNFPEKKAAQEQQAAFTINLIVLKGARVL